MSKLKQALKQSGIDTSSLDVILGRGKEAVHGLTAEGAAAIELWKRLRAAAGEIGYWPIVLGTDDDVEQHRQAYAIMSEDAGRGSAMDIIAAGGKIELATWLAQRAAADERESLAPATWPPDSPVTNNFTLVVDPENGAPLPRVYIGLVPTVIGWQAPAYLRFGGWNGCPSPEHHVAILKAWRHQFGAEVVGIGGQVLELAVSRPPTDRMSALRLAKEHYIYCPDVIRQGVGSLEARAASILGASVWAFWWE